MANITRYDPFGLVRTDPFADIDDMFKILERNPEIENKPGARPLHITQGVVRFDGVHFP